MGKYHESYCCKSEKTFRSSKVKIKTNLGRIIARIRGLSYSFYYTTTNLTYSIFHPGMKQEMP